MLEIKLKIWDPFINSCPFNIDPAYSTEMVSPFSGDQNLFTEFTGGDGYIYSKGALSAFLFNRLRGDAFTYCTNVYHPGNFLTWKPILYARCIIDYVPELQALLPLNLYFQGILDLRLNDILLLKANHRDKPTSFVVSLPVIKKGKIILSARVYNDQFPPVILIKHPEFKTSLNWNCSTDNINWEPPEIVSAVNTEKFPHQEKLPEIYVPSIKKNGSIYDFGKIIVGRPDIKFKGSGRIRIIAGESIEEAENNNPLYLEQSVIDCNIDEATIVFYEVLSFRYLSIEATGDLKVLSVGVNASFYPVQYKGAFASSDTRLTDIWMRSAYTLRLCMRELLVDGPKRDRLPWVGDLYMAGRGNHCAFFDKLIIQRTLSALMSDSPENNDLCGIIDYSMFWIISLHDYYMHTADIKTLQQNIGNVSRILASLKLRQDPNGLIPTDKAKWLFIDWAKIEKKGYCASLQMLFNWTLKVAAKLYSFVGDETLVENCFLATNNLSRCCHHFFWSSNSGCYVDNWYDNKQGECISRQTNLLALLSETSTSEQVGRILETVLCDGKVPDVGTPYMRALELLAISKYGRTSDMLERLKNYWGGMIDAGASTFWEGFDISKTGKEHSAFYNRPFGKSLCHAWSSGPLFLLSQEIFGLRPTAPGWERFSVNSREINIDWVSISQPTPYGNIEINYNSGTLSVSFPAGTSLETVDICGNKVVLTGPKQSLITIVSEMKYNKQKE